MKKVKEPPREHTWVTWGGKGPKIYACMNCGASKVTNGPKPSKICPGKRT